MTMTNRKNALVGLGMMLVGGLAATAAADNAPAPADPPAGQLLIAAAAIEDPRFYHGVILLVHHDAKGAFGIMINRPIGERPIAELLADSAGRAGKADTTIAGTIRVFLGGPVEPQYGFVVHTADYRIGATIGVADGVAMTATADALRDIGHHRGPAKYLFAIGYSGWAAGQLEAEMARHDWFTEPATPDLVFAADTEAIWKNALARRSREL